MNSSKGVEYRRWMRYDVHPFGHCLTNHVPHLKQVPDFVRTERDLFAREYLKAKDTASLRDKSRYVGGCSPKHIYKVGNFNYMVKPYHENNGGCSYQYYPNAGWAEMATQAIFQAAGMSEIHQRLFTFEQDVPADLMVESHPMIAVVMESDMFHFTRSSMPDEPGRPEWFYPSCVKIGFLDFLLNNNDRHGGNMMYSVTPGGVIDKILAIDHGRSIQYRRANRWQSDWRTHDHLYFYITTSPAFDRFPKAKLLKNKVMNEAVKWWVDRSGEIRKEMERQLACVVDDNARAFIQRCFDERADALDDFATMWAKRKDVRLYGPTSLPKDAKTKERKVLKVKVRSHEPSPRFALRG